MLSIKYLSNFLDEDQKIIENLYYKKINFFERNKDINLKLNDIENINTNPNNEENKKKNYTDKFNIKIIDSFDIIFNKNIINFYYDNRLYQNKSEIFTFINSILTIIDETFNLNDLNDKEKIIKEFIKLIDNDLFQKDLYTKFNYSKNRKFNKSDIQLVLKEALKFNYSNNFNLLKKYISDYLGINIYILKIKNNLIDFLNSEFYLTKNYNNNFNKYIPNFIIINDNQIYKAVLKHNKDIISNTSSILYSDNKEIIDNLWFYFNIKFEDTIKDTIEDEDIVEDTIKDTIKDTVEDTIKDTVEDTIKNTVEDTIKDTVEDTIKDTIKDTVEDTIKDTIKDTVEDNIKYISEYTLNENIVEKQIKSLKYNIEFLNSLKMESIKKLCVDNNILLQKKSEKTNKMINKLKNELINELSLL